MTIAVEKREENYLVLARKYRPRRFEDLYGQDVLVKTLKNAIEHGRLHHAYVLSGIRGTGKTTTARILAKVLNCENGPAISWAENDPNCIAIEKGAHVDVLEFDAASHTGVDDIRDLFEGVGYAPAQGRYKVYIIDEVHMLSKQAFNALLKTLEEPPAHVKFIFATTEVNKIPVTVLSRCQRFDLKRITAQTLYELFTYILGEEQIEFEESAIRMIARAADGSARDGLSLLDQAIVLCAGAPISTDIVASMLGQADKTKVFDLFDALTSGQSSAVLEQYQALYTGGFDPLLLLGELLQLTHLITRMKVVPTLKDAAELSELEKERGIPLSEKISLENLSRIYQILLHAMGESRQADRPYEAVEMALIRTVHLAALPSVADLVAQGAAGLKKIQAAQLKAPQSVVDLPLGLRTPHVMEVNLPRQKNASALQQTAEQALSNNTSAEKASHWQDWPFMVKQIRQRYESLAVMLEHQARVSKIEGTHLELEMLDGLQKGDAVLKTLLKTLQELTGEKWTASKCTGLDVETLNEVKQRQAEERIQEAHKKADVRRFLDIFEGSKVVKVDVLS